MMRQSTLLLVCVLALMNIFIHHQDGRKIRISKLKYIICVLHTLANVAPRWMRADFTV